MNALNALILFLFIGVFYVLRPTHTPVSEQEGGALIQTFAPLEYDISEGNPASYSAKKNQPSARYSKRPEKHDNNLTFWGHGIPLPHETRMSKPDHTVPTNYAVQTLSGKNIQASPDCCPSPYSSDRGCLCYHYDKQSGPLQGNA